MKAAEAKRVIHAAVDEGAGACLENCTRRDVPIPWPPGRISQHGP